MSTPPPDRCVGTFAKLCQEIRLMIWEMAIGPPSVHRIYAGTPVHLACATPDLIQSTATARAGLSVSRVDRDIILKWILPDKVPFECDRIRVCYLGHGVLRYNAAKDIICFVGMLPRGSRPIYNSTMVNFDNFYTAPMARVEWIHTVEKLAMEFGRGENRLPMHILFDQTPYTLLAKFCAWIKRLKRFYAIYRPPDKWMDMEEAVPEEETEPRKSRAVSRERLLSYLEGQIPWCVEGENSRGYFAGTCSDDAHLEGMTAFEWLESRQRNCALIMEVSKLNGWRVNLLHRCHQSADEWDLLPHEKENVLNLCVGILLHINQTRV